MSDSDDSSTDSIGSTDSYTGLLERVENGTLAEVREYVEDKVLGGVDATRDDLSFGDYPDPAHPIFAAITKRRNSQDKLAIVEYLLDNGAGAGPCSYNGMGSSKAPSSSLAAAFQCGYLDIAKLLVERCWDNKIEDETDRKHHIATIIATSGTGDDYPPKALEYLRTDLGIDLNCWYWWTPSSHEVTTPITEVCRWRKEATLIYLLDSGVDPNYCHNHAEELAEVSNALPSGAAQGEPSRIRWISPATHLIVGKGGNAARLRMLRLLIARGLDLTAGRYNPTNEILNGHLTTPLHDAVLYERYPLAVLLARHGAPLDAVNANGKTPLQGFDLILSVARNEKEKTKAIRARDNIRNAAKEFAEKGPPRAPKRQGKKRARSDVS